ncbi:MULTISPECIES: FAD-dependent monooxygenase [Bradyrhizobium]|jgi:2-polyprenyl-6-methoxyphenol hydroxylase-like FAD-dependent oxidoreductase|uniref:2-polyprenyl-6-methoxyphenol hydroxylase n=2 Tax=Bradyrhizobium TaxID=374 RepID=A0ABY0P6B8_9BRAD|nr:MULTISPECIES: NAD(P)/FAD-dependent oxidoreductase [Bradyrhizobium]SDH49662.1 2-polyprenyl-6-methoxyphenol hydroxylase [Bradyrhizobium ottawaense]SEE28307.1 2-polyprenyl-6-methoxyphenol hydroxylase [Bradyrhizobium lablabi]SHM24824.1 2-polyprenyl-6-methoxyphenol hydroxylase [Bradyrhizobium lablabi]
MRYTDVAIVGGGLAGSTAAAMLGRAGVSALLIDPHPTYPPELRCEKLGGDQLDLLRKTGLAEPTLRATTLDGEVWEARFGYVVANKPSDQHGIMYDTLVNTMRTQIPSGVETIFTKVTGISNSDERQQVTLSNGEQISARLVVLANGLNIGLRTVLGIERQVISSCHSITLGFDVAPVGRAAFDFPALTYWPKRTSSRMAYMTIFPIGGTMRVNLMVYRDMTDPWLPQFRKAPEAAMRALMPRLQRMMGDFKVSGPIKIRPADLCITSGYLQPGIVLVGDAFSTSCPAAGTGTTKVFTDVGRLCNVYIPQWLTTEGMNAQKIAQFYDDPEKQASETRSREKAYHLRSLSIDNGLSWRAQRWARFLARLAQGALRAVRQGFSAGSTERLKVPSGQPRHGRLA